MILSRFLRILIKVLAFFLLSFPKTELSLVKSMQKLKIITFIFLFFYPFTLYGASFLESPVLYDLDDTILKKVNDFRANPLGLASLFGLDVDEIKLDKNPSEWEAIEFGVELLTLNDSLKEALLLHLDDILTSGHLSHTGSDGSSPMDRAQLAGYDGLMVGETIIMLAFENFVSPETAVGILLDNLFRSVLTSNSKEGAPILFPAYSELGVVLIGGVIDIDGKRLNAYILSLLFGLKKDQKENGFSVVGRILKGLNGDGQCLQQEGIEGIRVDLVSLAGSISSQWTWPDGSYSINSKYSRPFGIVFKKEELIDHSEVIFNDFNESSVIKKEICFNLN